MLLLSLCDLDTATWLGLWWLLPFLLGILMGWAIWSPLRARLEECEVKRDELVTRDRENEGKVSSLKAELGRKEDQLRMLQAQLGEARPVIPKRKSLAAILQEARPERRDAVTMPPTAFGSLDNTDLQIIEGIGPKMEKVLKDNGLANWDELGATSFQGLRSLLDKYGTKYQIIDPSAWSEQAALAATGKWNELVDMQRSLFGSSGDNTQKVLSKVEKLLIKKGIVKKWVKDDLKAIEGIGVKIEGLLKKSGIYSWHQLAETNVEKLKDILQTAGDRFQLADPGTWPYQAGLAVNEEWAKLEAYQQFLKGGREPGVGDQ